MRPEESGMEWPRALAAIGSWQTTVMVGAVTLILGLIVCFHPTDALNVIAVLLGVLMIISGLFHLIKMFKSSEAHRVWMGISGLLLVVLGVVLIRHLHLTVATMGLIIGISWIVQGLSALTAAFSGNSSEGRGWWICFGIVSLAGGIVITAVPVASVTALAVLIGIWFVIAGLFEIFDGFLLRHMIRKSRTTIVNPPRSDQGAAATG